MHELDLHGLPPDRALRRVIQELHASRVRGLRRLRLITGRGWGNARQEPVLRTRIEAWLRGPEAASFGVQRFERSAKGGALEVFLTPPRGAESI